MPVMWTGAQPGRPRRRPHHDVPGLRHELSRAGRPDRIRKDPTAAEPESPEDFLPAASTVARPAAPQPTQPAAVNSDSSPWAHLIIRPPTPSRIDPIDTRIGSAIQNGVNYLLAQFKDSTIERYSD